MPLPAEVISPGVSWSTLSLPELILREIPIQNLGYSRQNEAGFSRTYLDYALVSRPDTTVLAGTIDVNNFRSITEKITSKLPEKKR